ncbi:phosphonate ABC transporter ATP-binding protein [Lewinellaceae bacterium SD302]|nr:phosphonate ABC transporter ATP-binding protein [Lewinellaceae bacterium SD302]
MSAPVVDLMNATISQAKNVVLSQVNLKVAAGEFTYLVGRTGSGKSSLLKTLYGDLPLGGGSGKVAGFDLKKLNRHRIPKLRRKLGIVFQDYNLLMDRSVSQNLDFVLRATGHKDKNKRATRIAEVLAAVDLTHKTNEPPHALSGGERQRIAFARALLNHPEILIADEATGNLDPETSDEILLLMRQLAEQENCAVIFATHDYRILENFQARIIRCHEGKVFNQEEMRL